MIIFKDPHKLAGLDSKEPILLALSGGADSSALLDLLAEHCKKNGSALYAAHVDHMIREDEHERDRRFCEALAKKYGIEIFTLEADLPRIAAESGESLELAARGVRYAFFSEIMRKNNIKILATAHNADDNLETVIFNLARGTGIRGACGIPPVRSFDGGLIVRPILEAEKSDILAYCDRRGLEYVTDRTNADDSYSRNRIRLNVIPELRKINRSAAECATRFSRSLSLDCDFIEKSAEALIESDGSIKISALLSSHLSPARCAVALAYEKVCQSSLETVHIDAVIELCKNGKGFSSISLPSNMRARIENGVLRFIPDQKERRANEFYEINLQTGKNILDRHILLYVDRQNDKNIYKSATQITIASDKIIGSLYARTRKPGDRIFQNGMHKELRKLMNEKKIPPELRDSLPVICDGEGILWVPYVGARDGVCKNLKDTARVVLSFECDA